MRSGRTSAVSRSLPLPSPSAPCSRHFRAYTAVATAPHSPLSTPTQPPLSAAPIAYAATSTAVHRNGECSPAVAPGRRRPEGGRWECVAWAASVRREHARVTVTLRYIDNNGRLRLLAASGGLVTTAEAAAGRAYAAARPTCCGGGRAGRVTQEMQRLKGWPQLRRSPADRASSNELRIAPARLRMPRMLHHVCYTHDQRLRDVPLQAARWRCHVCYAHDQRLRAVP